MSAAWLKATEIDLADCPDLGPILFTLGCFCNGSTVIRNAGRLRLKESDRISAMQEELKKMGARIEVDGDTVTITGRGTACPCRAAVRPQRSPHRDGAGRGSVRRPGCPPCCAGPRP